MTTPVDLTNLRSMTDGDAEMEKALFDEFFSSFEAGIVALRANIEEAAAETWRKQAHALKGMALNLGAIKLGELCKKGQEEPNADGNAKSSLLKNIEAEYAQVQEFLKKLV